MEGMSFVSSLFRSMKSLSKEVKQMRDAMILLEGFKMRKVHALPISRRENQYCIELKNNTLYLIYLKRKVKYMEETQIMRFQESILQNINLNQGLSRRI